MFEKIIKLLFEEAEISFITASIGTTTYDLEARIDKINRKVLKETNKSLKEIFKEFSDFIILIDNIHEKDFSTYDVLVETFKTQSIIHFSIFQIFERLLRMKFLSKKSIDLIDDNILYGKYANDLREQMKYFLQLGKNDPLCLTIDPGTATSNQIGELLNEFSVLYRLIGGSGLTFQIDKIEQFQNEVI